MKKLIALMLVIAFVFTLSACNDKNTASNPDTNVSTGSETFVKPENYASVLLVSINPQFKLYLDENNNVLAVEPVNEDAKSFSKSIDFKNKSIETVIGNIVEQANENGFIKENVTVNFEIAEQKEAINNSDILSKAVSAANKKATELKIEIKAEIKESDNSQTTETNSENTQTDENSKPTTSSKTEETTKKEESASKPTTTTKPTESSKPTHTHNFSVATCTAPQKCSCGATEGNALGHKWSEATCKAPKTCSICKTTEGNVIEHHFQNGKCSYCKMSDSINVNENFKTGVNYIGYQLVSNDELRVITLRYKDGVFDFFSAYYQTTSYFPEEEKIVYNGVTYYGGEGGGFDLEYSLNDTTIEFILNDGDCAKVVYVMQHDKKLRLDSYSIEDKWFASQFPVLFEIKQ